MTPLVSQLWPQFMVDPAFASCFGQVIVEHARMLRQSQQVIFTLRSAAPLDKGLCARLLASLQPDYEGFELKIENLFGYAMLDEAALRDLMEEMKRDGVPINGFLDRCTIGITGQKITIGVCHGTKFLQEMGFEKLLAERIAAHTGVKPQVTLQSAVSEAEQHQMEEKLERKIAPPVVKFEKKNTAPSIKVDGLDLTDKPVTIFHGKMFTPKNLTPLKDLGGEGGKCTIWGDVFFSEVKGNYRKIYTVSITDYQGSINLKIRAQEGEDCSKWESIGKGTTVIVRGDCSGDWNDPSAWTWTPVIGDKADGAKYTFGIDPERTRAAACNMCIYDGYLYIGEYNDEEIPLEEGKDVLQSIADYYMWRNQCPRAMGPENIIARKRYIFDLAEKYHADGIIVENMKFCEYWGYERAQDGMWFYEGYELPRSIPVCQIEKDYTSAASGQLRTRFQAFIESLEIKKIQAQQ